MLATFIWFAVLYTMSGQLNELGFMGYLGLRFSGALGGLSWPVVYVALAGAYVLLHYLFVSQTAHVLALFGVFLGVGVKLGVPAAPLAFMLLFASNFFSVITPQGSSANLLFTDSGYLSQKDAYRLGALTTVFSLLVYLAGRHAVAADARAVTVLAWRSGYRHAHHLGENSCSDDVRYSPC